jgi:hypothetical protein
MPIDLTKTIAELNQEKEKLERLTTAFDELASTTTRQRYLIGNRAGRKSTNAEEGLEVSARMKAY